MSSGMKREVINSRERAVSTDINRLQDFLASEVGQAFYAQCGKYAVSDDRKPGVEAAPGVGGTPPFNAILSGLRPYPVNGTVNMLVTPGELLVDNLAASGDDAPMLFSNDPGITAVGTLVLTGAPGAVRIDVIECQATTAVLETDNRDIYNIVTGLFAPAMVTKVTAARLTYRIRLGVPGAGFPGLVAGWVPLAVCKVDAAAATWDTVEIWDVRNLVSEFWNAPYQSTTTDAEVTESHLTAAENNAVAPYSLRVTGKLQGHFKHFRIGGYAREYPTGAAYVDITTGTTNWAAGMAVVATMPWYLYLAFPFSLPGWRKYAGSTVSPRTPYGLRGIPIVVSSAPPPTPSLIPLAAVALPTALGFGGTTTDAVCIFASMADGTPRLRSAASDGRLTLNKAIQYLNANVSDPLVTGISRYVVFDSVSVPTTAKSLLGKISLVLTRAAPPGVVMPVTLRPVIRLYDPTGVFTIYEREIGSQDAFIPAAGIGATWNFEVEIPLQYRASTAIHTFDIVWHIDPSDGVAFTGITQDRIEIGGWRL